MKVYMVTFAEATYDDLVFIDRKSAKRRLQELKDEHNKNSEGYNLKSYEHWFELQEFELIGEPQ